VSAVAFTRAAGNALPVSSRLRTIAKRVLPEPVRIAYRRLRGRRERVLQALLPEAAFDRRQRRRLGRFGHLRWRTDGLLHAEVYERLYEEARALPEGDIVEVGGASGAGSIALAWGRKDSGRSGDVVVIEKCEGGSRDLYGDWSSNFERFNRHVELFGVADRIRLHPRAIDIDSGPEIEPLIHSDRIAGLVLDADGRLYRDFHLFWERLAPNGLIVVDDYHPDRSRKHATTRVLLDLLSEWDLFRRDDALGDTVFGHKPEGASFGKFDLEHCRRVFEETRAAYEATHPSPT